jgi:hypothetical protein
MIASVMVAILAILASDFSVGFTRAMADSMVDLRLASESRLCLESLRRDASGSLPNLTQGLVGEGALVGKQIVGSQLRLCFDGTPADGTAQWGSPDTVIAYRVDSGRLLRDDLNANTTYVVAHKVSDMTLANVTGGIQVTLTLEYRDIERELEYVVQ